MYRLILLIGALIIAVLFAGIVAWFLEIGRFAPEPDPTPTIQPTPKPTLRVPDTPRPLPSPTPDFSYLNDAYLDCSGASEVILTWGYESEGSWLGSYGRYRGRFFLTYGMAKARQSNRPSPLTFQCTLIDHATKQEWTRTGWVPYVMSCNVSKEHNLVKYPMELRRESRTIPNLNKYYGEFYLPTELASERVVYQSSGDITIVVSCERN